MDGREDIEQVIGRLEGAPARFSQALVGLEDADSVSSEQFGEWSPSEVFARVRAANDIIEPRIYQALVREDTPLIAYDETRWLEVARYSSLPVRESLETLRLRRRELVRVLRALSLEEWGRTGNHEVRGAMSVLEIAQQLADHEEDHLVQIRASVGARPELGSDES